MLKRIVVVGVAGLLLSTSGALAYDRYYSRDETVSGRSRIQRDEALSATPRDAMRRYPKEFMQERPHDPSGRIILEGAM